MFRKADAQKGRSSIYGREKDGQHCKNLPTVTAGQDFLRFEAALEAKARMRARMHMKREKREVRTGRGNTSSHP